MPVYWLVCPVCSARQALPMDSVEGAREAAQKFERAHPHGAQAGCLIHGATAEARR
jgi:hypothetical protein